MTEVLITLKLEEENVIKLRGISPDLRINVMPVEKASDIPEDQWERTEILFTDDALPDLDHSQNLKWVQFASSGIDQWIDNPLFSNQEIQFTTLSGAAVSQMAEHAVMMMLALGHKIQGLMASQKKSDWPKDRLERFLPVELRGGTVGIVGYGSVGRQIAHLLQPFGATILALKRDGKSTDDKGYIVEGLGDTNGDLVHRIYPGEAIRSMLKLSDFIVVCLPLTKQTNNLINASVISSIKNGAYLINISRGKIIDHPSLIKALQDGKLAGASLDVFPEEPLPSDNPLWGMQNVIISPHIADNSKNFESQACELFSENLHRFLGGLPLYNLFNLELGY